MEELAKNVITVIIPAYNAAPYLNKCLDSVLNQTYQKLEVIVINDCSSDETAEIAAAVDDPRLRVINLPENHGQSYVRNLGIREAGGEFIAFIDADDFIVKLFSENRYRAGLTLRWRRRNWFIWTDAFPKPAILPKSAVPFLTSLRCFRTEAPVTNCSAPLFCAKTSCIFPRIIFGKTIFLI